MNMRTNVSFRVNGRTIDSSEPCTAECHADALVRVRNRVGFAHVPEEDQSSTPIEVSVTFENVPLTTINDYSDTLQVHGLDDMTVVDYNDAMKEADHRLIEAVESDSNLEQAIGDCSMGQLFLIMRRIKTNIDNRNKKE